MAHFLPCLLDRWSATAPSAGGVNWNDVRRDVIRNLDWLFNTEVSRHYFHGRPRKQYELPEQVWTSGFAFGLPCTSGRPRSSPAFDDFAWQIRARIVAFEPRIDPVSLEVLPLTGAADLMGSSLCFAVRGYLRADPLPLEFSVRAELDIEAGSAVVKG